ncbi:MAG: hypothetical protein ACOVMM_09110 [Chitinophagaceae bacterium]
MKYRIFAIAIVSCMFWVSCVSSKKTKQAPIKFNPPPVKVEPAPPVEADSLIPFTRELYYRLKERNLDIRKLQFFIDQTIVLSRGTDNGNLDIQGGKIVNKYGINENKIELLALTPGIVEAIEPDGLRVSFEQGSNLKFINNAFSPVHFIFSGANWSNGTAEVNYRNTIYRASCGTCGSVAEAKLVVRQKDIDNNDVKTYTIPGRTIY